MPNVKPIPEGLHTITPQISIEGAADAIETYKKAFGAQVVNVALDPSGKKVWHSNLRIGDSTLFVNDVMPEMGGGKRNADLWIYLGDVDAAYKRATGAGLKGDMPPADMFWGDRMAAVSDKWGNKFNIATHVKDLTPEQMKKAGEEFAREQAKQGKK